MGDLEKAKREIRFAKSTADDKRWDQLEPKIQAIEAALQGVPDADAAPIAAELKAMREKITAGIREEKAGRIERELKRGLSGAADELNRGYDESPQLAKVIARLDSAEAQEVLSAETVAKLQAEIAPLKAKQKGGAAPPPPKASAPAPAAPAGSEDAQRIENDVVRILKSGHDDVARNPSSAESSAARAATRLDAADAKQHLSSDAMHRLRAQVEELRAKIAAAQKQEKAGAIEREIQRALSAAADELNRGYDESPQLAKAIARLAAADARDVLSAESVAKFQTEIAPLQAKQKGSAPPGPAVASQPAPAATPKPASASTPTPAAPVNELAKRIENELKRNIGYALDELTRNPLQVESQVNRLTTRLDSDDAKQNLPPELIQAFRGQVDDLRAKSDAARKDDKRQTLERFIGRFIENAEEAIGHDRGGAAKYLGNATDRLERDDVRELCSAESVAKFKSEIARVEALLTAANRKSALDKALPILKELEERTAKPIFDGSAAEWQIVGGLESLKTRVRSPLSDLAKDDPDVKAIEARLGVVETIIAKATVKLGRDQSQKRVAELWEIEKKAIAGWEDEKPGPADKPTYEMPQTATAVRRLTWFLKDASMQEIESEYKGDKDIQAPFLEARKILEAATAKLQAAFSSLIAFMEKQPRPSNRIDLEEPYRLAGRVSGEFEGTAHKESNLARAEALAKRWDAEIEADRKAKQAKYDELTAKAAAAWPGILSTIKAEESFNPQDGGAKGRTVLIKELRNRIGWDFSGPYDFAIWVNEIPVVGNFDKTVSAAVQAACKETGLAIDDHTDWDAVIVVGGPGKIKLRVTITVRDRNNLEIGKIEEWRPVDCVLCSVIALRAGPAAAGPKA